MYVKKAVQEVQEEHDVLSNVVALNPLLTEWDRRILGRLVIRMRRELGG